MHNGQIRVIAACGWLDMTLISIKYLCAISNFLFDQRRQRKWQINLFRFGGHRWPIINVCSLDQRDRQTDINGEMELHLTVKKIYICFHDCDKTRVNSISDLVSLFSLKVRWYCQCIHYTGTWKLRPSVAIQIIFQSFRQTFVWAFA